MTRKIEIEILRKFLEISMILGYLIKQRVEANTTVPCDLNGVFII